MTAGLFALSFPLISLACSNDSSPVAPDLGEPAALTLAAAPTLRVSLNADRSNASALDGASLSGIVYVFVAPKDGIDQVVFYRDGERIYRDRSAPFDMLGGSTGEANGWDTGTESDGEHQIRAVIRWNDGSYLKKTAAFTVDAGGATSSGEVGTSAIDLSDAVIIKPGQTIQKIVNLAPKGTTFLLKSGVYLRQSVRPKDGMTFIGENGAVLDGDNQTAYAFRGDELSNKPAVHNVTISNLEIRDYRPDTRMGAIRLAGNNRDATGWVIEKSNIHHNGDSGIRVGDATVVRNNYIHHHYMHAMSGGGNNMLIVGNELAFNGDAELAGKNGAGLKFTHARNVIIRNNYVHDNIENGIWLDLDCIDALIEDNRVIDNAGQGIMFEISYGAIIRDNYVEGNGFRRPRWLYGAGIMASSSPDVEVYRNVVKNNAQGITGVQQDRGSGTLGLHELKNFYVHNNTITMRVGKTGIGVGWGGDEYFTKKGNRYAGNTYYLGSAEKYHQWDGTLTVPQWKGKGQDKDGKFFRL